MKIWDMSRWAFGNCAAAALLAGCGGSQPPIGAPGTMPQTAQLPARAGAPARTSSQPNLFVENYNDITEYNPTGQLVRTITRGIPKPGLNVGGIAFDSHGKLYVISGSFSISMYAPTTRKFVGALTSGIDTPFAIAFDRRDDLYVASGINESVSVFFRGHRKPGRVISDGINNPVALAFDSHENLYVANLFGNSVTVYSPNGTLLRTIQGGVYGPEAIALDSQDDLFVANGHAGYGRTVTIYKPQSGELVKTIRSGKGPGSVAVDAAHRMYVANADSNTATIYGPRDWRLLYRIRQVRNPRYVLSDVSDNLYLVCCENESSHNDQRINVYPPGSKAPSRTITQGVTSVRGIAFGPP